MPFVYVLMGRGMGAADSRDYIYTMFVVLISRSSLLFSLASRNGNGGAPPPAVRGVDIDMHLCNGRGLSSIDNFAYKYVRAYANTYVYAH